MFSDTVEARTDFQKGVTGCGIETACSLTGLGLGEGLFSAAQGGDTQAFRAYLACWRDQVRHRLVNPGGHKRKYTAVANNIIEDFPSPEVVLAYATPLTSWSQCSGGPSLPLLKLRVPNISKLASFCEFSFHWGTEVGIINSFNNILWESMVIRILLEVRYGVHFLLLWLY